MLFLSIVSLLLVEISSLDMKDVLHTVRCSLDIARYQTPTPLYMKLVHHGQPRTVVSSRNMEEVAAQPLYAIDSIEIASRGFPVGKGKGCAMLSVSV